MPRFAPSKRQATRATETAAHATRAFTLTELMMAAVLTSVITIAGFGMLYAATSASTLTNSDMLASRRGHNAMQRLSVALRAARSASVDSATQMTLWAADDYPSSGTGGIAGDDTPQVSELQEIKYDSTARQLVSTRIDFTGASAATIASLNVSVGIPGVSSVQLSTYTSNSTYAPYVRRVVWAEDVAAVAFAGHSGPTVVNAVSADFTTGTGASAQAFHGDWGLRSPGDYTSGSNGTNDGTAGVRKRLSAVPKWQ